MKITVRGSSVDLNKNSFISQGGEGAVYAKGRTAFKIYTDPSKMIPTSKIRELSVLDRPNIIRPIDVITSRNSPVGYTMRFVREAYPLCQLFTKTFKSRYGVQHSTVFDLIEQMRDTIKFVHDKKILIVDLNEMNFLVDKKFKETYFIDVDSYQTPTFPATAIMESIRDRHANGKFSEVTDWFSFAVVSFQMFVGMHPFKGTHPSLKTLDERMLANVSVLNSDVKVPKAFNDLGMIPKAYREWYEMVFEKGDRIAPPDNGVLVSALSTIIARITGSDNFTMTRLREYDSEISDYVSINGTDVVLTKNGSFYLDGAKQPAGPTRINATLSPKMKNIIVAWLDNEDVVLRNATRGTDVEIDLKAEQIMSYHGTIYAKRGDDLLELDVLEIGGRLQVAQRVVAKVMEQATKLFHGVAMQDILGARYAFLLPRPGACYQVRIKELDPYRVMDAKFDRGALVVIGYQNGKYDRFIFRFDSSYASYDVKIANDVSYTGINFVALETGVGVLLNEHEEIGIFSIKKDGKNFKLINDPVLDGQMTLHTNGAKVLFSKGNAVYQMEMKR